MAKSRKSRVWLMGGTAALVAIAMTYAFWPKPILVDIGHVKNAPMQVTIDEEARTRVHDSYIVSAPVDGRLLRVGVESGDAVEQGVSLLARMLPVNPPALDLRSREQGKANVSSAEAAVLSSQARLDEAQADKNLAVEELRQIQSLRKDGLVSQAAMDRAQRNFNALDAALRAARSAIVEREAELATARASLISFTNVKSNTEPEARPLEQTIPLIAPISGQVLQVLEKSETVVSSGTPIVELGAPASDLEIVAELLSTDAVKVSAGARVIIEKWGGTNALNGEVERLEPWGYTKFSALGVEEQRVNAIIHFTDPYEKRAALGHGFRVEVRIVIWENDNALTVPSSALFRQNDQWSVYIVKDDTAHQQVVEIGHNNGASAEVLNGLHFEQQVILYPPASLSDGDRVGLRTSD